MLLPMLIGAVAEAVGLVTITLPPWLLAMSYAFLGWSVGLGFTREILHSCVARAAPGAAGDLRHDWDLRRASPSCCRGAGIDPMTAYLATSPGGMDSVAIIGASSKADLSFVMALQTLRLVIVLIAGPPHGAVHRAANDLTEPTPDPAEMRRG